MLVKLSTTINNIYIIQNRKNQDLVKEFYEFMKNYNTFEKYQNNNPKAIIAIAKFLDLFLSFFIQLLKESKLSNSSYKIRVEHMIQTKMDSIGMILFPE
jgi:hypothetical protein